MKSYYVIDYCAVRCFIDIKVNDVFILSLNVDGQVATIMPINNAILETGMQQVSYTIRPLLGDDNLQNNASFNASVWLYDVNGDSIEEIEEINSFSLPELTKDSPLPIYEDNKYFYADVPYMLNAWQNSVDLSKIKNLRELVDYSYKKIENYIANAQYEKFNDMIQQREDNVATCMYFSEERKNQRKNRFIDLMSTGLYVVPVSEQDNMVIFGHNKLVTLKKKDGASALLLRNSVGEEMNLVLFLHLQQGQNELSVI